MKEKLEVLGVENRHLSEISCENINRIWLKHYDKDVRGNINYPEIPLYKLLEDSASKNPEKTALIFFGKKISYRELNELSDRVAGFLKDLGVKKGDRVVVDLPNTPHYVAAYYGILKLGAIVVQCNPMYSTREIGYIIENSGAEHGFFAEFIYPRVSKFIEDGKLKKAIICKMEDFLPFPLNFLYSIKKEKVKIDKSDRIAYWKDVINHPPTKERASINPREDVAIFLYTGGTTGVPKAVMSTHFNLVANALQIIEWLPEKSPEEVFIGVLPYFHSYGMTTSMNAPIAYSATIVLHPDPRDVKRILNSIQKYKVTIFCGVPTMYTAILNFPDLKKYSLKSIKFCISGAAPLPVEVKKRWEETTGGKLVEGYGLSEASPVTHANPLYGINKAGSIGIPLPDTYAVVVDDDGTILPVGEEGELAIYGPQVMKGYWNMEEETRKVLINGWLLTGDIAKMDEEGYFYIVDRKKDMIIAGGYNVYPREVEEVLYEHPAVLEAAVIGVPDPYRGEAVKAFVQLKPEYKGKVTEEELMKFCKEKLAPYKVPRSIEFRDELPKTLVGKVLRRALREEELKKMGKK
ncbi:MAG: long-chain fatty acid--CoA ligase [Archaeoglobaceae archaeon]